MPNRARRALRPAQGKLYWSKGSGIGDQKRAEDSRQIVNERIIKIGKKMT
jgi:hypothetical protein